MGLDHETNAKITRLPKQVIVLWNGRVHFK